MITKILASTAAISFALTATAFAQDKSADKPSDVKTEAVEQKAAGQKAPGLGAIIAIGAVNDGSSEETGAPDAQVMGSGSGAGKANFQDLSLAASSSGGEDRLTENVTLNFGVKEAPACVTESGAVDADCNGVADTDQKTEENRFDRRDIRKRPEPRQQRR